MNKPISLLALTLILFSACKKAEQATVVPERAHMTDFLYLPTKDAVWKIHTQGTVMSDVSYPCWENAKDKFDTAVHSYYTITATGDDTILSGKRFFRYIYADSIYISNCTEAYRRSYKGDIFFREDTATQQILIYNSHEGTPVVGFGKEQPGEIAKTSPTGPRGHISNFNEVIIGNAKAKAWEMSYDYKQEIKYFYKAPGIGSQIGLLPEWIISDAQPISLDFTYKGQHSHFDFPLHPNHKVGGNAWWGY